MKRTRSCDAFRGYADGKVVWYLFDKVRFAPNDWGFFRETETSRPSRSGGRHKAVSETKGSTSMGCYSRLAVVVR